LRRWLGIARTTPSTRLKNVQAARWQTREGAFGILSGTNFRFKSEADIQNASGYVWECGRGFATRHSLTITNSGADPLTRNISMPFRIRHGGVSHGGAAQLNSATAIFMNA
jgi:hypothetical protein